MAVWVLTVAALDAADSPVTLRFADGAYIDGGWLFYEPRMIQPALINVTPNDGGVFAFFKAASIGEVELANVDGGLNYLINYATDGRSVVLSLVNDDASVTPVFTGTVDRMTERGGSLFFAMKSLTEALTKNHPGTNYLGNNVAPDGLEGLAGTIEGNIKPKVFGDCRNVAPVLVNSAKLIYEASSRSDAVITAVYDDGVRLTNYLVNGAKAMGQTTIAVDNGVGAIPTGSKVIFDSHRTIYTVATGLSAGNIIITPALVTAITDNSYVEVINYYTGSGTASGQLQNAITASAWSSYNGYFRLTATPSKQVTCDVMSVSSYVQHKAGDVFNAIAAELSISVDAASITALNAAGVIGLFVGDTTSSKDLFDAVARSVGGYYHYIGTTLYLGLLDAPAVSASFTVEAWQVTAIEREATGIGSNGLPVHGVKVSYDKIDTVQQTVAGAVAKDRAEVLKTESRSTEIIDSATLTRHPLSEKLNIDSRLRTKADATAVATRLLNFGKVRRDVVSVTAYFSQLPTFNVGDTVLIKHPRLSYSAGRLMLVLGYELDIKRKRAVLRCVG